MSELDPRLQHLVTSLRRVPAANPAARERWRASFRREHAHRSAYRLVLTPAAAAAAALMVVALTSLVWLAAGRRAPDADASQITPVQFVFHDAAARTVTLVGDFNDWDPAATPLVKTGAGVWSVVVPLGPGTLRYSFLIDGTEWRADPNATPAPSDFGRPSSFALIGSAEAET